VGVELLLGHGRWKIVVLVDHVLAEIGQQIRVIFAADCRPAWRACHL
jgi:hypothetical protein